MGSRTMEPVDTMWLNMDRANNLMIIESLMTLECPMDWERFIAVLQRRVLDNYPVFSQRAVASKAGRLRPPHWEDDEDFSLERHLHRVTLAAPGGDEELQAFVTAHLSKPLPRDRALWEMHLIDGYGDGAAIYSRLHHSMADGIALTQVLLSLTDESPDLDVDLTELASSHPRSPLGAAAHLAGAAGSALLDVPRLLTTRHLGDAASLAVKATGVTTKLLFSSNPASPVKGDATTSKRAIWAPAVPLADVIAIAHRTGTTVNDVLMSALAGALSTYLAAHHGEAVDIPTMVPVNLRPLDQPLPRNLGNRFALVLYSLPSSLDTPFARLAETKRRMDAIKDSPEAVMTFGLIEGLGLTGPELERTVVDFFANKATGVTTNVPGPSTPRYVAGTRITGLLGWVPESGNQTLGTSIFSYDGSVFVGFKVDTGVITHPEELVSAFGAEIEALRQLAPAAG